MLDTRYFDKNKHDTEIDQRVGQTARFPVLRLFWPVAEALCYWVLSLSLLVLAVTVFGITFGLLP